MLNTIVIFAGSLDFYLRWNVVTLAEKFPETEFTVFLHVPRKTPKRLLSNQFRNLKRHGWRWIPYQLNEILEIALRRFRRSTIKCSHLPGQAFTLGALQNHPRITLKIFHDINGKASQESLKELRADLGIAIGAPILKEALFAIPRYGSINLHEGRLPHYRGMPPAFWELRNGEKEVGCTVHRITAGLDRGDILLEKTLPVEQYSTVAGMQIKLHHMGVNMVCDAVSLISAGTAIFEKQPLGGNTNTRPSLKVEKILCQQLKSKEPAEETLRNFAKSILFYLYASIFKPFMNYAHGKFGNQRVIILLYHRVSDQFRDHVTIGIENFDRQMAYIAANYNVVSLHDVVNGNIPRNSSKPVIAVSFDDGYLDNFDNAAPILLKHQVPCTFFISTEKITENKPFDHDLKLLGFGLDNMSWQQVAQMRQWGFDFGSHTSNHVDLAIVSDSVALTELTESFNDIRARLRQENLFIAYPYGGKRNITTTRIEMIKSVGYAACFSAYGGTNDRNTDLFDIKRVGINWAFDMLAFKARLKGWDDTTRKMANPYE
jgi:methionyl-tRNA formyltransferase